jgi:hypothetical protein
VDIVEIQLQPLEADEVLLFGGEGVGRHSAGAVFEEDEDVVVALGGEGDASVEGQDAPAFCEKKVSNFFHPPVKKKRFLSYFGHKFLGKFKIIYFF